MESLIANANLASAVVSIIEGAQNQRQNGHRVQILLFLLLDILPTPPYLLEPSPPRTPSSKTRARGTTIYPVAILLHLNIYKLSS